jgi:hypothetical protein
MKFQNASGGILENPFKLELESFIEVDIKLFTVIPPNSSGIGALPHIVLMPEPIIDNDDLSYFNKSLHHI